MVGVSGTTEQWQNLRNGSFTQFVVAGALTGDQGYDGQHGWNRDATGLVWDDASANAKYAAQDQAYFGAYQLWAPDRGGATVSLGAPKTDSGKTYDVLSVTPPDGLAFDVWIDQATHLPNRIIQPIGTSTTTISFGDYRAVRGLRVPFSITSSNEQGAFTASYASADTDPSNAAQVLARPQPRVDDFSIAGGSRSDDSLRSLVENHVYVWLKVNPEKVTRSGSSSTPAVTTLANTDDCQTTRRRGCRQRARQRRWFYYGSGQFREGCRRYVRQRDAAQSIVHRRTSACGLRRVGRRWSSTGSSASACWLASLPRSITAIIESS